LFWHPVLVLPTNGEATVSFDLCDSVTTFQATAFAHTLDGRLGAATARIESRLPLSLAPKVPIEVTASDTVDVPLSVANTTDEERPVRVALTAHDTLAVLAGDAAAQVELPAGAPRRTVYRFRPTVKEGTASLAFEGKTEGFDADAVRHTVRVVPE